MRKIYLDDYLAEDKLYSKRYCRLIHEFNITYSKDIKLTDCDMQSIEVDRLANTIPTSKKKR
jgi:hypothetical protein